MTEKSSVKAHGDGAAQIAVESLDYCQRTRCLVSVAEGAGSVRLWDVSGEGESNYPSISDRAENYYRHTHCEGVTQADDSLLYTSLCRFLSGRLAAARRLHGTISYVVGPYVCLGYLSQTALDRFFLWIHWRSRRNSGLVKRTVVPIVPTTCVAFLSSLSFL